MAGDRRSIESEGDTIDQAIENALRDLGVARERVEIEILAAPARGVLGFGGRKARIRATVRAPLASTLDDLPVRPRGVSRETEPSVRPVEERAAASHVARAADVLSTIIAHLGVTARIESRPGTDPGSCVLDVIGDSSGLLIGHRGQTLDALEYLVNRIVSRDGEGDAPRLVVDVERYRERRSEYLGSLARRLAQKVRQTGQAVTLNPMTPRDRRIVHLALQGDESVMTRSEGEGSLRRLLIFPAGLPRSHPSRREG